jgi:hypothetical protein
VAHLRLQCRIDGDLLKLAKVGTSDDGNEEGYKDELESHGARFYVRKSRAMSRESRFTAGHLVIIPPTVMLGGVSILTLLILLPVAFFCSVLTPGAAQPSAIIGIGLVRT